MGRCACGLGKTPVIKGALYAVPFFICAKLLGPNKSTWKPV